MIIKLIIMIMLIEHQVKDNGSSSIWLRWNAENLINTTHNLWHWQTQWLWLWLHSVRCVCCLSQQFRWLLLLFKHLLLCNLTPLCLAIKWLTTILSCDACSSISSSSLSLSFLGLLLWPFTLCDKFSSAVIQKLIEFSLVQRQNLINF